MQRISRPSWPLTSQVLSVFSPLKPSMTPRRSVPALIDVSKPIPLAPLLSVISKNCMTKPRSEEHTSELQSLMRTSYAVFCLKKKHDNEALAYIKCCYYFHTPAHMYTDFLIIYN